MTTAYCIYIYNLMRRCLEALKKEPTYDSLIFEKEIYADKHFANICKLRFFSKFKHLVQEIKM